MKSLLAPLLLIVFLGASQRALAGKAPAGMVEVPAGVYKLFYKEKDQKDTVSLRGFYIDKYPVTNKDYLEFVKQNPRWRKSAAPAIFASGAYLQKWPSDLEVPSVQSKRPVIFVSWFAAKRYCEFHGKRLLTVNEWEYTSDGGNSEQMDKILSWYGKPNEALGEIAKSSANKFGVHDMHGLVWEWVEDYASVIVKADSRSDNNSEGKLFCGGGALGAASTEEYTTFMRFAFRSSLKGNYVTENLGFRCGKDLKNETL